MKKLGRTSLKKNYVIFVAACLIAAFLGAEFTGTLSFSTAENYEQTESILNEENAVNAESDPDTEAGSMVKTTVDSVSWENVLRIIAESNTETGREITRRIKENEILASESGNPMFGRTRGVLSNVVNQISSGSIIVTMVAAIASMTGSESIGILVMILLGAAGAFGIWFLLINVFPVVIRRVFLEGMIYEQVTSQRFVFLLRVKKWLRASWIMFVKYIWYSLWCLTIAGISVKRYSYYLVPFIVAENPDMTAREAVTLSRKMMEGHKWECFVFELTFLGWEILGILTMGIFNIFYTNPYKTAAFTRYYAELRAEALEREFPDQNFCMTPIFMKRPVLFFLNRNIRMLSACWKKMTGKRKKLTGWRGFLAENFGILLLRRSREREYEKHRAEYVRLRSMIDDVQGLAYPVRLYPVPEEERRKLVQALNYMRHYSVWSLMAVFLTLSVFGWLWEVGMHLVSYGEFVNRGALHGPWLPIYGTGAVLMLTLLYRFRGKPVLEFCSTILLCGFLEYMTSLVMEIATGGMKWWDYSGYFLNLNGRICAEGLLVFGVGGLAIVYVIAPVIDGLIGELNEKQIMAVCSALIILFAADAVYSQFQPNTGKGITDIESGKETQKESVTLQ